MNNYIISFQNKFEGQCSVNRESRFTGIIPCMQCSLRGIIGGAFFTNEVYFSIEL